jgi:AGCS family alanine or glycine:cation symporter
MTALVILLSGVEIPYGQAAGAELTISGFTSVYGNWVSIFTAIAMCCFAFSTIVGWGLYGARCAEFLLGSKIILPFNIAYCLVSIVGATTSLSLIWGISDTFNGFMTVPNLIGIFLLTPILLRLIRDHFFKEKKDLRA